MTWVKSGDTSSPGRETTRPILLYMPSFTTGPRSIRAMPISRTVRTSHRLAEWTFVALTMPGVLEASSTSQALTVARDHPRHMHSRIYLTIRNTCRSPVCRGRNRGLTFSISRRQWLRWTVNTSTAHSTAKFMSNTWSFSVISNTCAVSGTAPWRRLHLRRTYSRMQLTL